MNVQLFRLHYGGSVRSQLPATSKGLFSWRYDNTLKVWDLEVERRSLLSALFCCTVAPNGVTVVAGDESGRVYFLRLEGIEPLT
ncbi:hypothetical protein QUB05_04545 [Microcoleus sp. F10-C6]|uniref:hypothetical protein n=1 Tax=unclassified Microcoleus TaxID=2642155 RepID=UPI002FD68A3B